MPEFYVSINWNPPLILSRGEVIEACIRVDPINSPRDNIKTG
jgi:hypothetical protein